MGEGPAGEFQGTARGGDIQSPGSSIVPIENFLEAEPGFARSRNAVGQVGSGGWTAAGRVRSPPSLRVGHGRRSRPAAFGVIRASHRLLHPAHGVPARGRQR